MPHSFVAIQLSPPETMDPDAKLPLHAERTKAPVERVPSPILLNSTQQQDQELVARGTPTTRSFPARKRIFGISAESPAVVLVLGAIALLLFLAVLMKNNQATLGAALTDAREHLRFSFRGTPPRPKRFSVRVKCGPESLPAGPIGSSEGCLVVAPSCSETWVTVLEAGEERVIDGLCRDDTAGIALVTQRCDGTCRAVKPDPNAKPVDDWSGPTKEFVIESIGAKGSSAGSLCELKLDVNSLPFEY
jgi:hypothetical protein